MVRGVISITSFLKVAILFDVEVVNLHKPLLFGPETSLKEPFKRGFSCCPEEEGVGQGEVQGSDEEANWLHHVPTQLPEGEPHEAQCLGYQKAQPTVEFSSDQSLRFLVDLGLLLLHLF